MNRFIRKAFFIFLFLVISVNGFAAENQNEKKLSVQVSQLIDKGYPNLKAYVTVNRADGQPLSGLGRDAFSVSLDNGNVSASRVNVSVFKNTNESVNYNIIFPVNLQRAAMSIQATAIVNFVDLLSDKDKISIYSMGNTVAPIIEDVSKADFQTDKISTFEGDSDPNAGPRIYDSLQALVNTVVKKEGGRKVIIVISDERDNNSVTPANQFMNGITRANIPIFTIGTRAPSTSTQVRLEDISYTTGAVYYYTPMIRDLSSQLSKVVDVVSDSYILEFRAKTGFLGFLTGGDGNSHDLKITVDVRDGVGEGLKKYTAIKKTIPVYLWIVLFIFLALVVVIVTMISIISKRTSRKSLGITNRRCPDCGSLMKDSWDECPFCKYLPDYLGGMAGSGAGGGGGAGGGAPDFKGMGDKAKGGLGKAKGGLGKAKGTAGKAKGSLAKGMGMLSKFKK